MLNFFNLMTAVLTTVDTEVADTSVWENVVEALTSTSLWNAIAKSIIIILLGFFLTKKGIFSKDTPKVLTKIVLVAALPCLAFTGFMSDITQANFISAIFAFVWGFIIYTIFIFLAQLIFRKVKGERKTVLIVLFVLGSTTFFGQPLISAVFKSAILESNMFNISYRVFLYSYAFIVISGINKATKTEEVTDENGVTTTVEVPCSVDVKDVLKKIFLNPIIIATLAGFILWSLQLPFENVDWVKITIDGKTGAFWRLDVLCSPINSTLVLLGSLASPLVWLAIGGTLSTISFKEAAKDKTAWIYSILKIFLAPTVNLVLLLLVNLVYDVNFTLIAATTLMWATPPATVAVSYCINYDKEALLASNCSFLGTFVAVIGIPIWIVILTVLQSAGIFA
ncbi:MAG: AEC family transporter [bacterium]